MLIVPLDAESGQAHPGTGSYGGGMVPNEIPEDGAPGGGATPPTTGGKVTLSLVLIRFLAAYGIAVGKLGEFVSQVLATLSVPADQQAAVEEWLKANGVVNEDRAKAIALLVFAELRSGEPGYDPQAGGGA